MKQRTEHSVYLIASRLGLAKIGVAPEPRQRLRELQVGSPVRLELALAKPYPTRQQARAVAEELARRFAARRAHGHWYRLTTAEVRRALASPELRRAPTRAARARAAAAAGEAHSAREPGRGGRARTEKQRAYQRRRLRARAGKQRRAAKLFAQGLKQLEVAAALEVSARTLRNWSKTPAFQRALARELARAERARTPAAPTQPGRAERQKPGRLAGRKARQAAEARTAGGQEPVASVAAETGNLCGSGRRAERSAGDRGRQTPPLELEPFSDEWLAWYAERRLRSEFDMLNHNDALRGLVPRPERRARAAAGAPGSRARPGPPAQASRPALAGRTPDASGSRPGPTSLAHVAP
jgi:hypothetical protein